jgi:glycoprotein endo-alpha-1,2-mannosidase
MQKITLLVILLVVFSCKEEGASSTIENTTLNYNVHTFYYNWYGNTKTDGDYYHWNHDILPHWSDTTWNNAGGFPGGDDIGANYYPELDNYSSNDESTIKNHMKMMQQAGIGVFAITWWGKDSYEDKSIKLYLDIAEQYNIKLVFHIEPFYKSAEEFRMQLSYLNKTYGTHNALYKVNEKPFYYVYDSYKIDATEWQKLFDIKGDLSIRNTELDGTFIGLWVNEDDGDFFINSGFDGFYTYFASDGFVYGSTTKNWEQLSTFAKGNHLLFIPCAGPGYIDTRIRPWNAQNTKTRDKGHYYKNMFLEAVKVKPDFIGITSFNEWHEGTQIEPAIPKTFRDYDYEDYGIGGDPWFYIKQTKTLVGQFKQ